jgi:hypothetical protein
LTALLSPLRESLSHLRKSCDGGTGSSGNDTGAGLVGPGAGTVRAVLPFTRGAELGDPEIEVEGAAAAAAVFPFAPTTVHALPGGGGVGVT